jgi:putative ABC transport system ATP-binding protein
MKNIIIKAEKLCKTYKLPAEDIHAVSDIDLTIHEGDFISIMGPSGSGKTTLLDALGCLGKISGGKLFVMGKDVSSAPERTLVEMRRKFISFIFQDFMLIPSLTAIENLELPLHFSRSKKGRGHCAELLNKVGLAGRTDHLPCQLSGGEKQRVAIARALANSPKVLFADEPTGNLDSKSSQDIFELFRKLNKEEGFTVVVITHNPELGALADKILRLKDGKIVS